MQRLRHKQSVFPDQFAVEENLSAAVLRTAQLFTPIQVGSMELEHRVVMAPLTRSRSVQPGSIPGDLMLEYYSQRASEGGLIVSEGTSISIAAGGGSVPPANRSRMNNTHFP